VYSGEARVWWGQEDEHVAVKRPVDLCDRHAGPTVGGHNDES
jgi:uncharacterized RmlC-like cupin family protein